MSHLIFTFLNDPHNPSAVSECDNLADAKATAARKVDAIEHLLLHMGYEVSVQIFRDTLGEQTFVWGRDDTLPPFAASVETKVGVLA